MSESRKVWTAFQRDLAVLEQEIAEYGKENMTHFDVKVHGIKGAARQLGDIELSTCAEQMEKAAKEQDNEFLELHIKEFVRQLGISREHAEEKLRTLQPLQRDEEPEENNIYELFAEMKQGFELYDIDMVEDRLLRLERLELTPKEHKLVEELRELCDNLEYEAGSELLTYYE